MPPLAVPEVDPVADPGEPLMPEPVEPAVPVEPLALLEADEPDGVEPPDVSEACNSLSVNVLSPLESSVLNEPDIPRL